MSDSDLTAWAKCVLSDLDARTPWRSFAPPETMTPELAYSLQGEVARLRAGRGERVIGYKLGCTSRVIQEQLGTGEPILGRIFDTGSFPDSSVLGHARFANLAIEGELAVRLASDLTCGKLDDGEYAAVVASVFPVIELHHYILPRDGRPLAGLITSGGMHAGLVLPLEEKVCSGSIPDVVELEVSINDQIVGVTRTPWTMGSPAASLRWLAARLDKLNVCARRGDVILTGSPLPLFPVKPGDRITACARPLGRSSASVV